MIPGLVLDAGGLIAWERRERRVVVLLERAHALALEVVVPATALAQVVRRPASQVPLMRLLRQPGTHVVALDRVDASFVGQLLAASDTTDVVDAHVVVCSRRAGHPVVTSDGRDLQRLDPTLELIEV